MLRLMHVRVRLCIEKVSGTDTFIDAGIICCTLSMHRPLPQLLHSAAQFAADAQSTNINVSKISMSVKHQCQYTRHSSTFNPRP